MQNSGQLLILAVFVVFAVWVLSRGRRQQREMQLTQSRIAPGTEVMTTSGVYATVVEVGDDNTVRLETSPGVVSRWDRRAVARILASPQEPGDERAEEPAEEEPGVPAAASEPAVSSEPAVTPEPALGSEHVEPARPIRDAAPPDRD